jgi:chorismate mutase
LRHIVSKLIRFTKALLSSSRSGHEWSKKVGQLKREAHLPVTVPSREQQVIAKAQELAKGRSAAVGRIYQRLVEEMRDWETKHDTTKP